MLQAGVVFDMDGVLVNSYSAHLRSWCLLAEEVGEPITETQFAATFGRTSRDIIQELFRIDSADEVRRLDDRKEALYRDVIRGRVPAMPGAVECIQSLHTVGFRLAVGSSGPPENVALVCTEMDLDPYFSARVTGADVQRGKPDPQVFLLAAERLGLEASACVVVEDAPSGIEAARRAGMRSIALTGSHKTEALSTADRVIDQLADVRPESVRELLGLSPI